MLYDSGCDSMNLRVPFRRSYSANFSVSEKQQNWCSIPSQFIPSELSGEQLNLTWFSSRWFPIIWPDLTQANSKFWLSFEVSQKVSVDYVRVEETLGNGTKSIIYEKTSTKFRAVYTSADWRTTLKEFGNEVFDLIIDSVQAVKDNLWQDHSLDFS
jgi:hypothetical protein